ncbi:MAG: glycosyltransferase family 39 protein [Candidatus Omnitrophica bacterium]|nr:glycosyltransferase family 39 protein [Candidatus Omnitrophota bacterium]
MKINFLIFSVVFLLGIIIRIWFLFNAGAISGDEFYSLTDSTVLFKNMHAILYFYFLHFWSKISNNDIWLRFLSFIFSVATIPVTYLLGKEFLNKKLGVFLAACLALSPMAIHFSAEVRFYAFYLFFVIVSCWLFFSWLNKKRNLYLWLCILSNICVITSHLYGLFLVFAQFLILAIIAKKRLLYVALMSLPVCLLFYFIFFGQDLYAQLWPVLCKLGGSPVPGYSAITGFSFNTIAKIASTFYNLLLGYGVYPWSIWVAFIFCAGAYFYFSGLKTLCSMDRVRADFVFLLLIYLPIIFILLEALWPPYIGQGYQTRYSIFILPFFLIPFCINIINSKKIVKYASVFFITAVLISGVYKEVALIKEKSKFQIAIRELHHKNETLLILHDGRSNELLRRYLDRSLLPFINLCYDSEWRRHAYEHIYSIHNDWRPEMIELGNKALKYFDYNYKVRLLYYNYPTTIYELNLAHPSKGDNLIPARFMSMEFKDIALPLRINTAGKEYVINNCLTLQKDNSRFEFKLPEAPLVKSISVMSNCSDTFGNRKGEIVGEIKIKTPEGEEWSMPLRYGIETYGWLDANNPSPGLCPILRWHKKIALIGKWGYSEKYKDATGTVYFYRFNLQKPLNCKSLEVLLSKPTDKLHLWGLFLE